jgi:hypothetical protein
VLDVRFGSVPAIPAPIELVRFVLRADIADMFL